MTDRIYRNISTKALAGIQNIVNRRIYVKPLANGKWDVMTSEGVRD